MQADFLLALLEKCRSDEIHSAVDTTCYAEPALIEKVAEKADLFLCDLKHLDKDAHKRLTGVDNNLILRNIEWLSNAGKEIIIRIPIIPRFNDDRTNITMTGEFVASLHGVRRVDILPFNPGGKGKSARLLTDYDIIRAEIPDAELMNNIANALRGFGLEVKMNG